MRDCHGCSPVATVQQKVAPVQHGLAPACIKHVAELFFE
jgi:hypothetical protein